jgi:uncharacterized membrane protein YfcA
MAGGMILIGLLLVFLPVDAAMVLHGITQAAANGWRAWLWRAHIRWRVAGCYAAGAIVAAAVFSAAQLAPSKPEALIVLGLLSLLGLCLPARYAPDITLSRNGIACGVVCTVLQLTAGVSGAVLDVCFVRSELGRKEMIATKAVVQLLGHLIKIAYFGQLLAEGGSTVAPAAMALAVVLAVLGTQLSRKVLARISDAQFRGWTRVLIAVVSGCCLVQGLWLL